ncbi:MAG: site-2 protease family protein [Flavobacteriaceae bacterium]|nr:site-2 protease family protein [Flavobacteriaceae bacterium]
MKANLSLGSVSGIKIMVHWTFFFLIAYIAFYELKQGGDLNSIAYNIVFILAVFFCVVLHELGHALTAKRFGITTKKITLLPIGGVASLERIPENPKEELLVAVAGPLVNVIIALLLFFIAPVQEIMGLTMTEIFESLDSLTLQNFLFFLFVVNVGLVLFNLIPAFPMDGGRMLRAVLAMNMNRVKATLIASRIGQTIAVLFLLLGLLYNPFLVFIALFVFLGAYGENRLVQNFALLDGHTVKEAMMTNITVFKPQDPIEMAVKALISGTENNFIVMEDDVVKGIIYHKNIIENSKYPNRPIKEVMNTSFQKINSGDDLKKTFRFISAERRPFFPVEENGKFVGAIDLTNLSEFIALQTKLVY